MSLKRPSRNYCGVPVGRLEVPSNKTNMTQDQASRALTIISDKPIWHEY